jgi:D-alanine--poly(phosphoribitol) ligase subunit 1
VHLLERIDRQAERSPGRPFLDGLSWGELRARSDALAAWLNAQLGPDRSPVMVYGHKEPDLVTCFLACAKAGHPYVPVDAATPSARAARIAEIAGVRLTLAARPLPAALRARMDGALEPAALDAAVRAQRGRTPDPARRVGEGEPYYILFTSGSTGEPKGVAVTLRGLASFLRWMLAVAEPRPGGEVFLNQAPFSFDLSVMDLYLCLASGGRLWCVTQEMVAEPRRLFAGLSGSGVTVWVSTPSFARLCLAEPGFGRGMLPRLRRFLFCGEVLPPETAAELLRRFPGAEVWNTYGPTEATVAVTAVRVDRSLLDRHRPLPVGYPKADTRVEVLPETGEILISGPSVSPGYVGRPDLTARSFLWRDGRWTYRTGDRGRIEQGLLFWEGRLDLQVKLHGHRVEPGEVEARLRELPGVADAVVLPVERGGAVESLAACVVLDPRPRGGDFQVGQELRARLAAVLPAYMLPRRFVVLDRFPMTPSGKADRRRLACDLLEERRRTGWDRGAAGLAESSGA